MNSAQKGESLVEVLVVLALAALVLTGVAVAVLSGMKNAQFAKNQIVATKYAQEAIDQIKALKERNGNILFKAQIRPFSDIFSCDTADAVNCNPIGAAAPACADQVCYFHVDDQVPLLKEQTAVDRYVSLNDYGLTRMVYLKTVSTVVGNQQLIVRVNVAWTDSAGSHESTLESILAAR